MVNKKRHSTSEIRAKLDQASDLAAQGKLQSEIARSLGISVMTYHRWRKSFPEGTIRQPLGSSRGSTVVDFVPEGVADKRISELELENSRLRRLITDMLLEKVRLEEALQGSPAANRKKG
jgi:hypothetical protein